jgi:predicted dehydrogenase
MSVICGQSFATYRPGYRDIYFSDRERGGGAIQDALTHLLNLGEWFVGPIDRVVADAAHQQLDGVTVEDTVHTLARHGKVLANYAVNLYQQPNEFSATVVCERGTIRYELHKHRWRWMDQVDGCWHDEVFDIPDRDTGYIRQASVFLDAVEGNSPPLCTLEEGIQTLRVNLAVLSSVDSEKWEFVS